MISCVFLSLSTVAWWVVYTDSSRNKMSMSWLLSLQYCCRCKEQYTSNNVNDNKVVHDGSQKFKISPAQQNDKVRVSRNTFKREIGRNWKWKVFLAWYSFCKYLFLQAFLEVVHSTRYDVEVTRKPYKI